MNWSKKIKNMEDLEDVKNEIIAKSASFYHLDFG